MSEALTPEQPFTGLGVEKPGFDSEIVQTAADFMRTIEDQILSVAQGVATPGSGEYWDGFCQKFGITGGDKDRLWDAALDERFRQMQEAQEGV